MSISKMLCSFEDALFFREGEDLPQVTIRIGDKLVFIAQGSKLYLLMKDLRWTDFGKTEKPSSLFHPASDPPMQYEDGTAGVGTRMWMRDRVMLTSIHMTFIWRFVPTNQILSRPQENSLPNKGISIILARFVLYHESSITDFARLSNIKHARTASENNELNTHDAPDVFIDFYLVIRTTGQAMVPYCIDCRFRSQESSCPSSGLVIDPREVYKPGREDLRNRAHFPGGDSAYQDDL